MSELEELRAERARLWEELGAERFHRAELESLRAKVARMEGSLVWRATQPLRELKLVLRQALGPLWHRLRPPRP